jgi:hypothetical protein
MQLIHRLQQLAQTKNLYIVQMKFSPMPDEQGFEASALDFSLKGSQAATYAYWQALNQLFQNGLWPKLMWRLLPTGEYLLEGQIHLLWDAEDAFTDTGVELQAASRAKAKNLSFDERVLPDHSVAQMRLVGTVQTLAEPPTKLFWTFLQSGRQISAVRPGQYLGIENRLVLSLDAKGLWLADEFGQPATSSLQGGRVGVASVLDSAAWRPGVRAKDEVAFSKHRGQGLAAIAGRNRQSKSDSG